MRLRPLLPWLGFAAIALLAVVRFHVPDLEADPAVRAILLEDARRANLRPVNEYGTLARPAAPIVEIRGLAIRQMLISRLIASRSYTATLSYSSDGRPFCDRFRLVWSNERNAWTSRAFTTRGCNDWFARP